MKILKRRQNAHPFYLMQKMVKEILFPKTELVMEENDTIFYEGAIGGHDAYMLVMSAWMDGTVIAKQSDRERVCWVQTQDGYVLKQKGPLLRPLYFEYGIGYFSSGSPKVALMDVARSE